MFAINYSDVSNANLQWGKDRPPTGQFDNFAAPQGNAAAFGNGPAGFFPQYGGAANPMNQGKLHNSSELLHLLISASGPAPAGRGWDQQANNFNGAAMAGQAYAQAGNAGGYGRGQPMSPSGNWDQSNNFNGGYQA